MQEVQRVGGGSINETFRVQVRNATFFCKINSATKFPQLFSREKEGLDLLGQSGLISVPRVHDEWIDGAVQVLLMEWVEQATPTPSFWKSFGEKLARLHSVSAGSFGLLHNNYMGSVPQDNEPCPDWPTFFVRRRLEPLVSQCSQKGLLDTQQVVAFDKLYRKVPSVFSMGPPSLLHGDLWSGNFLCNREEEPVLIDPAVYYGHPAVDLGMTTLFGGFDPLFYRSYNYHHSGEKGYDDQWAMANLYPLLIHLLLFGRSYLHSIVRTLSRFS